MNEKYNLEMVRKNGQIIQIDNFNTVNKQILVCLCVYISVLSLVRIS